MGKSVEICTDGMIKDFEVRILKAGRCDSVLPCYHIMENGAGKIRYNTAGAAAVRDCEFKQLDQVLELLYQIPLRIADAEDYLLSAEGFWLDENNVYLNIRSASPKFVYGRETKGRRFMDGYIQLLRYFKGFDNIIGLREAMTALEERIRSENPDLHGLALITESVRMEWNVIYPSVTNVGSYV